MTLHTYFLDGPAAWHSPVAQLMLRFGLRWDEKQPDCRVRVTPQNNTYRVELLLGNTSYASQTVSTRRAGGHFLSDVLVTLCEKPLGEWGYLVGMRPTKLLHPLLAEDDFAAQAEALWAREKVSPRWGRLLTAIGERQRPYLSTDWRQTDHQAAVYIGIPFCPSHCVYCSFPARVARPDENWDGFLAALLEDVQRAGALLRRHQLMIDSVYFGGGTPTVLPEQHLQTLLTALQTELAIPSGTEFTVEAGRPDTITAAKLAAMRRAGVTRLSINPQTLQDRILQTIHRAHTGAQIEHVYAEAQKYHFDAINMDFIAGLPDQTIADMKENLDAVARLRPENVTVHTLALKRHSPLMQTAGKYRLPSAETTRAMADLAYETLCGMGYEPYYLYRQKYLAADLANIGYALPGTLCRYNIQMMGERIHILGIGPGATNKVIKNAAFQFDRCYFPWDNAAYSERVESYLTERDRLFQSISQRSETQ